MRSVAAVHVSVQVRQERGPVAVQHADSRDEQWDKLREMGAGDSVVSVEDEIGTANRSRLSQGEGDHVAISGGFVGIYVHVVN